MSTGEEAYSFPQFADNVKLGRESLITGSSDFVFEPGLKNIYLPPEQLAAVDSASTGGLFAGEGDEAKKGRYH